MGMDKLKLSACGLGLVLLASCAAAPPPPTMADLSLPMEAAVPNPWSVSENNTAIFSPAGGICPETVGSFIREDYTVMGVQDRFGNPRYDGICQYKNDDIASFITAYVYITEGLTLADEMTNSVSSVRGRNDVAFLADESESCSAALEETSVSGQQQSETTASTNGNVIVQPELGRCAVMQFKELSGRTFVSLDEHNGWFFKVRATTRLASAENYDLTIAALLDFHAQQP